MPEVDVSEGEPSGRLHGDSYSETTSPEENLDTTSSSHTGRQDRRPEEPADEVEYRDDTD